MYTIAVLVALMGASKPKPDRCPATQVLVRGVPACVAGTKDCLDDDKAREVVEKLRAGCRERFGKKLPCLTSIDIDSDGSSATLACGPEEGEGL